jgi:hypothetical protein
VVQRFEQRGGKPARDRRRRVMDAIDGVLARHNVTPGPALRAAFLLGMARAAILEHAPDERPETHARAIVDIFLHGVTGRASVRRRRRAA